VDHDVEKIMVSRQSVGMVLASAIALAIASGTAWADSDDCGRVGTWFGAASNGMTWLATDSPGTSATAGQASLEWVRIPPNFFNYGVDRLTNGKGNWVKVRHGEYKWAWVAYGVDTSTPLTQPIYMIRVSGTAIQADCNHIDTEYTGEFFIPADNPTPIPIPGGIATETRMLLP
jgi:hypothetical protein